MQVVRREFHRDAVSGQDLDEVHSHFAGDVRENFMSILEHDTEGRIGKTFLNDPVHLNRRFFGRTVPPLLTELIMSESQDHRP